MGKTETLKLIDLWADNKVQEELEGCHHNRDIYQRITAKLQEAGYDRTLEHCHEKIKKLHKEYRKIKDKNKEIGQGRESQEESWTYFEVMDAVMGHKPATCPSFVIDTLADDNDDTLFTQQLVETDNTDTSEHVSTPSNTEEQLASPSKKSKKKKHTKGTSLR